MSHDVKVLKLVTGEEVICDLVEEKTNSFSIKSPLGIMPSPSGNGLTVFPWSVATVGSTKTDEIFTIFKNSVIMIHKAPDILEEQFLSKLTGINRVSKPNLVTDCSEYNDITENSDTKIFMN